MRTSPPPALPTISRARSIASAWRSKTPLARSACGALTAHRPSSVGTTPLSLSVGTVDTSPPRGASADVGRRTRLPLGASLLEVERSFQLSSRCDTSALRATRLNYAADMPESGIPISEWSGSGATDHLRETISEFNATTAEQTAQLVRLTKALVVLTALLFVGLLVQVVLAIINLAS